VLKQGFEEEAGGVVASEGEEEGARQVLEQDEQ
jgi:hypothetical protein